MKRETPSERRHGDWQRRTPGIRRTHALAALPLLLLAGPLAAPASERPTAVAGGLECPEQPADAESAKKAAGAWFAEGTRFAAEGRFAEAEQAFRCSNRMVPHPATLLNLAKAARLAGHTETAVALYRRFIERYPTEPKVAAAQTALDNLLAAATPTPGPASDGTAPPPRESTEDSVPRAPPEPSPREAVSAPPASVLEAAALALATPPARPALRAPGIALLAVGLSSAAAGAALQSAALYYRAQTTRDAIRLAEHQEDESRRHRLQISAGAIFGVAGASLIAAVFLLVLDRRPSRPGARRATPAVTPTSSGGTLTVTFGAAPSAR